MVSKAGTTTMNVYQKKKYYYVEEWQKIPQNITLYSLRKQKKNVARVAEEYDA